MKKFVLIAVFFYIIAGGAAAQQITTSQFEGYWILNYNGEEIPEIVFFGNVMMIGITHGEDVLYIGSSFTHANQVINFADELDMPYRLSGAVLTLNIEGDEFQYIRATGINSPLEGIWEVKGGAGFSFDDTTHFLFTNDIMAIGHHESNDYGGYFGYKIRFVGNTINPLYQEFEELTFNYRLSGGSLSLISNENDFWELVKIY